MHAYMYVCEDGGGGGWGDGGRGVFMCFVTNKCFVLKEVTLKQHCMIVW